MASRVQKCPALSPGQFAETLTQIMLSAKRYCLIETGIAAINCILQLCCCAGDIENVFSVYMVFSIDCTVVLFFENRNKVGNHRKTLAIAETRSMSYTSSKGRK